MANVLGSLVVDVLANTGTFVSGMEKASVAARRSGRDIQESFSKVGDFLAPLGEIGERISGVLGNIGQAAGRAMTSFHSLGSNVATFAAVGVGAAAGAVGLGGALFAAATHAAELGSQIFEASEKTGLSASNLSGLMAISKATGGNFDGLTVALSRASVNLTKTAEGAGKINPLLFGLMGGAKGVAELGLKPMDDRLQTVLARIFALNDVGQRNVALSALLGKGWQENVGTLRLLAEQGYGPAIALAQKMGVYFDAEHARQAKDFQTAWNELQGTLSGFAVTIGQKVIPPFISLMATVLNAGKAFKGLGADINVALSLARGPGAFAAALAQDKLAWDDYTKSVADFRKQIADMAAGEKGATAPTEGLDRATGKLAGSHTRAAKATADHAHAVLTLSEALQQLQTKGYDEMIRGKAENVYTAMQRGLYQVGPAFQPLGAAGAGPLTPFASQFQPLAPVVPFSLSQMGNMFQPLQAAPKQLSALETSFHTFFQKVSDEGADFGTKLAGTFAKFTDGLATQFAHLVVTGKANFRELFRSLEEEIIKSGIEKLFAQLAQPGLGATSGGGAGAGGGGGSPASAGGLVGILGKIFGGFLQHGGDVTPGKAYVVGERHPEFFVPKRPGEVRTALDLGRQNQTVLNFHVHGVQDFDSFRHSQSQVMSMFQNQLANAFARNSG